MAMAKRTSGAEKINPIILDKAVTNEDGDVSLHLLIDLQTIFLLKDQYADALRYSRGVPFDINLVSGSDPISLIIAAGRPKLFEKDPDAMVRQARQYYSRQENKIQEEAMVLAVLASPHNDEVLGAEPKPYPPNPPPPPGVFDIPSPDRDLDDPVEARLKVFYDVIQEDPGFLGQFNTEFNRSLGLLATLAKRSSETDKMGFQPSPANS
jgi:hypothetical protein